MSLQTKYIAGISLGVMGVGFAASIPFQGTVAGEIIQGGFEAGLVGGLADWFAVTALFRHPMGIPIPHTALLPKNRKRVTKGLINTLENEWLTKESITNKVKEMQLAQMVLQIAEREMQSDAVKKGIVTIAEKAIVSIDTEKLAVIIEKELKTYLHTINTNNILQVLVDQLVVQEYDEKTLDYILVKVKDWTAQDEARYQLGSLGMKAMENIKVDGFLQFTLKSFMNIVDEDKIGGILQKFIISNINSLQEADNSTRQLILAKIRQEIINVKENEALLQELENWKEKWLANWNATDKIKEMLEQVQQRAVAFVNNEEFADKYVIPFLQKQMNKIKEDEQTVQKIEEWLQKQVVTLVEKNHSKIGKLVQENLDKLDDKTLIEMIENNVGKDLQWIRVNGAVCGFMIGLVLEGIKAII
ncbi:Predicted membrane protein [Streptococcus pneumoniae]|nr:Predicted membrane protein [Streptococcus pneumoniae]